MKDLFIGKPLHWIMVAAMIAAMYVFGAEQFHRVDYAAFLFAVLGLAAAGVALVLITYRPGDRITREPIEPAPPAADGD